VGKTALLEALSLKFVGKPHRSQLTASTKTTVINPISSASVKLAVSGAELKELLLECGEFHVPAQVNTPVNQQYGVPALESIFSRDETHFILGLQASRNNGAGLIIRDYPTHGLYPTSNQSFNIVPLPDKTGFSCPGISNRSQESDFGVLVADILRNRIYKFDAE